MTCRHAPPLHLAAKHNNKCNIIALLMNDDTVCASLDNEKKTPLHYCNGQNLDIFLSKFTAEQALFIEDITAENDQSLWSHILKNHPSSIRAFLDLMVTKRKLTNNKRLATQRRFPMNHHPLADIEGTRRQDGHRYQVVRRVPWRASCSF